MPIYPNTKTYKGGFYRNEQKGGVNDRTYTAEDMRAPYDVVYTDGLLPDADGMPGEAFKVSAVGGMVVSVAPGHAKVGGAWIKNEGNYIITLDNATGTTRYDCIILRNDDEEATIAGYGAVDREPTIYVKSLYTVPTVADLVREENAYEICLAYVKIDGTAAAVSQSNIVDTRADGALCNVMSGVGAVVTRTFRNTVYTERAGQTVVVIGIPQFDRTRDQLTVIVEGRILSDAGYSITSNTSVELALGLPVIGTRVDFEVRKNVNAAGADTVVNEVASLMNEAALVRKTLEHHYYCNGQTDNVNISALVSDFQIAGTDYASMRLVIHGTFGATSPRGGSGTADNSYYWFRAAQGSASNRQVTLDFTDCKQIAINCSANTHNIIFFGMDARVVGANVVATGGAAIYMFSTAGGTSVYAENCRFWVTCDGGGMIARSGTFKNCRASVTNSTGHSYCFVPISASLLRVDGGEYYAYTGSAEHVSAVVGATSGTDAIAILYGVNAPTVSRPGYRQTNSVYQTTGWICSTDLISALPLNVVSGLSNIRGTIALSKAGMM